MERSGNGVVAAFVSADWHDQARLRLWAKNVAANVPGLRLVLLTDDLTDGNSVLGRQLRCSGVVSAVTRIPGLMRSQAELAAARGARDRAMASVADVVFDFGEMPGGEYRFGSKPTVVLVLEL